MLKQVFQGILVSAFCIPFCGFGLHMFKEAGGHIWEWRQIQSWQTVPAQIESVELNAARDEDSTSYKVLATYTYNIDGMAYTSDRVDISGTSDNFSTIHHSRYKILKHAMDNQTPVDCFMNPTDPVQAVLYRDLRLSIFGFQLVFGIIFSTIGFGLIGLSIYMVYKASYQQWAKKHHPDKPWFIRKDWAAGKVTHDLKAGILLISFFALFANTIAMPITYMVIVSFFQEFHPLKLLVFIFTAIGLYLLYLLIKGIMQWIKYGTSTFIMEPPPGVIGGALTGRIMTSARIVPERGFTLTLKLLHKYQIGTGKSRRTKTETVWQTSQHDIQAKSRTGNFHTEVPVDIEIPTDLQESIESRYVWQLEATAATPGVDYKAQFDVPVFNIQRVE